MVKLLYKIIHYELSPDHKDNVLRSFYFIWAIITTLPVIAIYVLFRNYSFGESLFNELLFYGIEITVICFTYYLIVIREAKLFIETPVGIEYFDFGKFNGILKILAFLFLLGVVVVFGRMFFVFWSS
jgi:hypothetical protein